MRNIELSNDEYYHIFNRGAAKGLIFNDFIDYRRFLLNMLVFNSDEPVGGLYALSVSDFVDIKSKNEPVVEIIAYCLNPNHFHIILKQLVDGGISKFMHKIQKGYSYYFNSRNDRSGTLYQGTFKAVHIDTDEYLQHVSAYINLNSHVHKLGAPVPRIRSSWDEYVGDGGLKICKTDIVLDSFKDAESYKKFALESLEDILRRKKLLIKGKVNGEMLLLE